MRRVALVFCLGLALVAQSDIYRWKDKKGKEHVTNTPPPAGAIPLKVPPPQNQKEEEANSGGLVADQTPKPPEAPLPGLTGKQLERWKELDQRLEEARTKKDTTTIEAVVEGLFRESLWGNGLWAIPLLPLATLALVTLLGWWVASGLRQPLAGILIAIALLGGVALAQLTLSRFLYRNQFLRLQTNLNILEHYLGGKLPRASNRQALQQHYAALEAAARPLAPPWAFLLEARVAEETMVRVALDP
jgi:Domain of unknown function (DUF4124)